MIQVFFLSFSFVDVKKKIWLVLGVSERRQEVPISTRFAARLRAQVREEETRRIGRDGAFAKKTNTKIYVT